MCVSVLITCFIRIKDGPRTVCDGQVPFLSGFHLKWDGGGGSSPLKKLNESLRYKCNIE